MEHPNPNRKKKMSNISNLDHYATLSDMMDNHSISILEIDKEINELRAFRAKHVKCQIAIEAELDKLEENQ